MTDYLRASRLATAIEELALNTAYSTYGLLSFLTEDCEALTLEDQREIRRILMEREKDRADLSESTTFSTLDSSP